MKQQTHLVDVQRNDISADLWLWRHHGRFLHLFPVGSQVGQPEVVVHKLKTAQNKVSINQTGEEKQDGWNKSPASGS